MARLYNYKTPRFHNMRQDALIHGFCILQPHDRKVGTGRYNPKAKTAYLWINAPGYDKSWLRRCNWLVERCWFPLEIKSSLKGRDHSIWSINKSTSSLWRSKSGWTRKRRNTLRRRAIKSSLKGRDHSIWSISKSTSNCWRFKSG